MLKFLTSLSFLYAMSIIVLLLYGIYYYRNFSKARFPRRFPLVFSIIGVSCVSFLWVNIHAPMSLQTFSNLDHHFIRHDGFEVNKKIELGRADTANYDNNSFNRFVFVRKESQVHVNSVYSEEPFYMEAPAGYKILSVNYPAIGHVLSFRCQKAQVTIRTDFENDFELRIGENIYKREVAIKKAINCWNIFREDDEFINSTYFGSEGIVECLKSILLLRDDVKRKKAGDLKYFLSAKLFNNSDHVIYDGKSVNSKDLQFDAVLPDQSNVAWGIGFLENNRNQFYVAYDSADNFSILNRYPVSYPLSEENRDDWSQHKVSKFLLADYRDMMNIPAVFREGFLFSQPGNDVTTSFAPVLLSYQRAAKNDSLSLGAQSLGNLNKKIAIKNEILRLPARSADFTWLFSIDNTYNWHFNTGMLSDKAWQKILFGSLGFFFLLIFISSLIKPVEEQSWVWQLASCVILVLLTTRFFLYWRYKSFPPYEGMDLPSWQQLTSFSNFGIVVFASLLLGLILGFPVIRYVYQFMSKAFIKSAGKLLNNRPPTSSIQYPVSSIQHPASPAKGGIAVTSIHHLLTRKIWFFGSWFLLLVAIAVVAAIRHFDPGICRHLAIASIVFYFIFLFLSYRHSPLVESDDKAWWKIGTHKTFDLLISNPLKILLSVSLLALLVFIDIGFAIVFLNFLLFHEVFLCINYSIGGLSAGSKRNAILFGGAAFVYSLLFILNLLYAPQLFRFLMQMSQPMYVIGYAMFSVLLSWIVTRLMIHQPVRRKMAYGFGSAAILFCIAFFFFPKERILEKASMTKYRIDVLTMPVDKAIEGAYEEGKTYEPVIRAAQNQWFINTFIHEENNPGVQLPGFNLLPHAPQNKGAKYNAQATDLVASRFLIAEHGKWSALFYALLLLLPSVMLATFYQLYPDFTSRVNSNYPRVTAGFAILNYLLIAALMVILAATGRYIFFGQDLPFGSILSKQSLLFPSLLIVGAVVIFKNIPQEYYANRRKVIPGAIVFTFLFLLLFFVKPVFNKNKEFSAENLVGEMDSYVQLHVQPLFDYFDTSSRTKKMTVAVKDRLFSDSLRKMIAAGVFDGENKFFLHELTAYARSGFSRHLDQRRILYLDLYSGHPQLAVNSNFFRVEPPPHLQQLWEGNVFGDTATYNFGLWDAHSGSVVSRRVSDCSAGPSWFISKTLQIVSCPDPNNELRKEFYLANRSSAGLQLRIGDKKLELNKGDSVRLSNPCRIVIINSSLPNEQILTVEPDVFMKNYFVNGSRYYQYPLANRFTWARNFAEAISPDYATSNNKNRDVFVSFDFELMDSLSSKIQDMMANDTSYHNGAEYGIAIADGDGRLIAMADFINGMHRPDPNDKAGFNRVIMGENGEVSQSLLRKQIGNINLLRMNPGPGSTLKPIVFSAIASQLNLDWDAFAAEGFLEKQHYYGGEKVAEYDFEKSNGVIRSVADYLKYSDNYYHSNVLLLGSYPKQDPARMLSKYFASRRPADSLRWPYFTYTGKQYWLNGFENWPGYTDHKADFGSDSSFTSIGLFDNYDIYTHPLNKGFDMFKSCYDTALFLKSFHNSGFILPEYALFDQRGEHVDHRIPYDLFTSCFRGHVKGSSQVLIPPTKMLEAYGRMITQSRNYNLTLNPYATALPFASFYVDSVISYNYYLSIIRESVFTGMKEALYHGTAARLGGLVKDDNRFFYYAKTGTTGDDKVKTKSKLMAVIISSKDVTDPDFNFRQNKFYTIYFTSQNGPPKQNEEFQAAVVHYLQETPVFKKYMGLEK